MLKRSSVDFCGGVVGLLAQTVRQAGCCGMCLGDAGVDGKCYLYISRETCFGACMLMCILSRAAAWLHLLNHAWSETFIYEWSGLHVHSLGPLT